MKTKARRREISGIAAALLVSLGFSSPARASGTAGILIDFDDYTGIYWVHRQARDTFAWSSTDNGTGAPVLCNGASWCWEYAQPTTDDESPPNFYWFYVSDWNSSTGYGNFHYHLSFEDPTLSCVEFLPEGPSFGRTQNGACVLASDYAAEPRYVNTHWWDHWISAGTQVGREFYAHSVWNRGNVPIQVWVLANDYNWYFVDNLGGQTNWGLSTLDGPAGIFQIDIGPASSHVGAEVIAIDDLLIDYVTL